MGECASRPPPATDPVVTRMVTPPLTCLASSPMRPAAAATAIMNTARGPSHPLQKSQSSFLRFGPSNAVIVSRCTRVRMKGTVNWPLFADTTTELDRMSQIRDFSGSDSLPMAVSPKKDSLRRGSHLRSLSRSLSHCHTRRLSSTRPSKTPTNPMFVFASLESTISSYFSAPRAPFPEQPGG